MTLRHIPSLQFQRVKKPKIYLLQCQNVGKSPFKGAVLTNFGETNEKSRFEASQSLGTGWECSKTIEEAIFLIGAKFGEFYFLTFFEDFQRAAAAFSGEN